MVSFLDGPLAAAIAKGFQGKLLSGTLTRAAGGTTADSHGDTTGNSPVIYPCSGFVDKFSDFFRAQNGIPDTDVSVTFIANSMTVQPNKDDKVTFVRASGNETYQIRKLLDIDPARATYSCQGFKINGT